MESVLESPAHANFAESRRSRSGAPERRLLLLLAALLSVGTFTGAAIVLDASPASAIQFYAVYKPESKGAKVQGWANIKPSCPYIQCMMYMKIERSSWSGPRMVNGSWVNWKNDWVSMEANKLAGCYDYRTTVEIYQDSYGPIGGSVNIGKVGIGANGKKVYRYKIGPWSSGWTRSCR